MEDNSSKNLDTGDVKKKSSKTVWLVILAILVVAVFGYVSYMVYAKSNQIAILTEEKAAVENEKQVLTQSLTNITDAVSEIATKLQDIRKNQVAISDLIARTDTETSQKEQILSDINAIQNQLDRDKSDMAGLVAKMQQSNIRIKSLETMVSQLRKEIDKNIQTVAELRSVIESKDEVIKTTSTTLKNTENTLTMVRGELTSTNKELQQTKNTLEETQNTAYYVIGTRDKLKESNIIDEKGWLIRKSINLATDLNDATFTKIDISRQKEMTIPCEAKHIKVIPERSESSYNLEAAGENQTVLRVTDPDKFWKIRYMAVVVKG